MGSQGVPLLMLVRDMGMCSCAGAVAERMLPQRSKADVSA